MVNTTLAQGCHYLGRVPANVKFPAHKILDDGSYLSWINPDRKSKKKGSTKIQVRVVEYTIDELKTHLLGRKTPIRSLKPREVVQEIYGWLLGHYAIRSLMTVDSGHPS